MGYRSRHPALGPADNYAILLQNCIRDRPKIGAFKADCLCEFAT